MIREWALGLTALDLGQIHLDLDLAVRGEFHCVGGEVDQNLAHAGDVTDDRLRHFRGDIAHQLDILLRGR